MRKPVYALISLVVLTYLVGSFTGNGKVAQVVESDIAVTAVSSDKLKVPPMRQPVRIASSSEGDIFVSDYTQGQIYTLDSDLNTKKAFAVSGRPLGISWAKGKVFVGNESTHRVEVYNRNGKLLYELGAEVASPTDIAIDDARGLVFVVDGQERVVKVFDTSGAHITDIPKAGVPQDILLNPTGIAVDTERSEVVVSDFGDPLNSVPAAIKVYDYDGIFRFSISGDAVQRNYLFSRPQGIALDTVGNFYVVDSMLGKVLAFDRNTRLGIKSLGSFGTGSGELKLPLDVIIDETNGDVLVTNTRNGRVEVFGGGGLP
jgi:DNA-binding beta-propeller fold protein YncE